MNITRHEASFRRIKRWKQKNKANNYRKLEYRKGFFLVDGEKRTETNFSLVK